MVDAWLIVVTVISIILMLAINIYLFIMYSHPDDLKSASGWFSRIVIVFGSALGWGLVLMLPLDVANSRGDGGGFNMELFYMIMFIIFFAFIVVIAPFTLFYYESDDEKSFFGRLCYALWMEIGVAIVTIILVFIAYGAMRKTDLANYEILQYSAFMTSEAQIDTSSQTTWTNGVQCTLPGFIFIIVFVIFIGWFLFVIFGGVGLVALPMDMIIDYFYRPRPRSAREMAERKVVLRRRVEELMAYTRSLEMASEDDETRGAWGRWRQNRKVKGKESKLQAELYMLEQEYEIFEAENNLTANPVTNALLLVLGIFLTLISFVVWLHLLVYKIIIIKGNPVSEFLNGVFKFLEFTIARFISTIAFAALCIYLLLCVLKGNIKFGLRLFFIIRIHPMKLGRTFVNTFLFNVIFVLLCVPAMMHFIIELFQSYMRLTSSAFLFTGLMERMKFFKFFWSKKIFLYAFLIWSVLTFFFLLIKPKSDRMDIKKMIERRKKV